MIVPLDASPNGTLNPTKSNLKLPNTGSTKLVPERIASLVESGLKTAIASSVVAPIPPTMWAIVPSTGSSSSPTVTTAPF